MPKERAAIIVTGLGFGDEGKGATVDFLAATLRDTAAVVRWSGGAQAAHNVIHGPRHHTFRQFGAGTLLDVPTILRAPMVVDPLALGVEAEELRVMGVREPLNLITADPRCLVTTRIHAALNIAREEARGARRHGSCGMGVGETVGYALAVRGYDAGNMTALGPLRADALAPRVHHLHDATALRSALDALMFYAEPQVGDNAELPAVEAMTAELLEVGEHLRPVDARRTLNTALESGSVIFEGSQGVLLDEFAGFHPHTTFATVSPGDVNLTGGAADSRDAAGIARQGLASELKQAGFDPYVLGVTRTYTTRHGAGPFPTEDATQNFAEPHNGLTYQGAWRQGALDVNLLRYAARTAGVDGLSVTHMDVPVRAAATNDAFLQTVNGMSGEALELRRKRNAAAASAALATYIDVEASADVLGLIEAYAGAPAVITAHGPERRDRSLVEA